MNKNLEVKSLFEKRVTTNRNSSKFFVTLFCLLICLTPPIQSSNKNSDLSKNSTQQSTTNKKQTIKGQVLDVNKQPIIGATIFITKTEEGFATDVDGKFTFHASLNDEIVVSYIGMTTITRKIAKSPLVIVMKEDAMMVDDIVVTGYQAIDRKMFTGSATSIKADEAILKGSGDFSSSLQGKVAGLAIANVSSTFGASPIITIRGNSSINGTNKPLWVIDGIVLEDLTNVSADDLTSGNLSTLISSGVAGINPEDIQSFEILKDVSATSLYGAQAMNGVIIITTKQGKKGQLRVNYTGSLAIKQKPRYSDFDIMNSADEMSIYKELESKGWIGMTSVAGAQSFGAMGKMFDQIAKGNINWGPNGSLNEEYLSQYANANTDWFDELFQNSIVNQHSVSVAGGSERSTYYASMSYYDEQGMSKYADEAQRFTANLRGVFDLSKKVKLGLKLSADVRDQVVPGTKDRSFDLIKGEFSRDFDLNPFNYVLNSSRSMRAYDDNGDLEFFRRGYTDFNIIHELQHNYVDVSVKNILAQADIEVTPVKQLKLKGTFSYRVSDSSNEHKIHENSNQANAYRADDTQQIIDGNNLLFKNPDNPLADPYSILPEGGFYNVRTNRLEHTYFRGTADYSPIIGDDHSLNIFAGFEATMANREKQNSDGWGYIWDSGGVVSTHPDLMKFLKTSGQVYYEYKELRDRKISAFTNVAYSYKGKYVLNGGFRYDGSNQLGSSSAARYLPSWNISAAWNLQEEAFMQNVDFIDMLKPRFSYGYNGMMGPSTSAELKIFGSQTLRPTDNEIVNEISDLTNDDLTWESMKEFNIGFDFAILNNRIRGSFDHYRRKSIDQIDWVETSGIGGVQMKLGNIGDMESSGFEFALNTVNVQTKNFEWSTNFNMSFHDSEITKLNNFSRSADAISNLGAPLLGYPRRGLFSVKFAGLDEQGIPTFYGEDNEVVYDMNLQNREDLDKILHYEGSLEAKGNGGLNNNFRYKNWTLGVGFVYRYGNKIRLDDEFFPNYSDTAAFPEELKNRWMIPGDENVTNIPAILDKRTYDGISGLNTYQLYNKSTERVASGDFIRLKDITLQYSLPRQWLAKTFINSAKVSFQATNVWLLYSDDKLNGIDPEFFLAGGVSLPVSTMYTFTLNLSF